MPASLRAPLADVLAPLEDHSHVAEVRAGVGLIAAVELSPEVLATDSGAVARVVRAARDHGVLVRALVTSVAVSPPLTVQHDHLSLIESLAHAFDAPPRPMAGTR